MSWREHIIAALDPAREIDVHDERHLGSEKIDYRAGGGADRDH